MARASATKDKPKVGRPSETTRRGRFTIEAQAVVKERFLQAFAETGIVLDGLRASGVSTYSAIRNWLETDEQFKLAYDEAYQHSTELIQKAVFHRGVEGVQRKKHTFYKGRLIHTHKYKEYSDRMLELEVKRRLPEYRERQEMTHTGDVRFIIQFEGDTAPVGEIIDGTYRALPDGQAT